MYRLKFELSAKDISAIREAIDTAVEQIAKGKVIPVGFRLKKIEDDGEMSLSVDVSFWNDEEDTEPDFENDEFGKEIEIHENKILN
ncbi:hypothetical protein KAI87_10465 [Myxococcota bacterium]|nr:hypothetical protein [Myxococcota bacterium]